LKNFADSAVGKIGTGQSKQFSHLGQLPWLKHIQGSIAAALKVIVVFDFVISTLFLQL